MLMVFTLLFIFYFLLVPNQQSELNVTELLLLFSTLQGEVSTDAEELERFAIAMWLSK